MINKDKQSLSGFGLFGVLLLFIVTLGLSVIYLTKRPKLVVKEVLADGTLQLSDNRKISLSGIRLHSEGEPKYEAGIFLLSEITKNVEVWLEAKEGGYGVWIGCRDMLWKKDCKDGVLINDELVKVGVATLESK